MSYSLDPISEDCYPGTTILINKFDIHDEQVLEDIETAIVAAKSVQWECAPCSAEFDFNHYKAVHTFLFDDLYEWAGKVRQVNISKKGTQFCKADQIEEQAVRIFGYLKQSSFLTDLPKQEFVTEIVELYCALNDLHPFREGNGRVHRVFITQLIRYAGHDINFSDVDGDLLMIATIQTASGVTDHLRTLLFDAIK